LRRWPSQTGHRPPRRIRRAQAARRSQRRRTPDAVHVVQLLLQQQQPRVRRLQHGAVRHDNASRQTINFNIQYQLFNGFTREANSVALDVTLTNAEAQLRDAKLAARQNLTSFVRSLENAQARANVQLAAIAAAEEDLRVQQQRYALGASTLLDLLTSQTQLNVARQALIQARFDSRVARAQLSSLLGRDVTIPARRTLVGAYS
jgi:outer membrane protein